MIANIMFLRLYLTSDRLLQGGNISYRVSYEDGLEDIKRVYK